MQHTIVITGGSSGIGKAIAEQLAAAGNTVYELSRSGKSRELIHHIDCDLSNSEQIKAAFAQIAQQVENIDILINNAGIGVSGATEFLDEQAARRLMDIDFFAVWLCTREALPMLRRSYTAKIINISSVAAVFAIPFQSFYSAAKAAVNTLSSAMAIELASFNIKVTAVMLGDVKSSFTSARIKDYSGEHIYGEAIRKSVAVMEKDEQNGMSPQRIATAIMKIAAKPKLKPLYSCGAKYKLFLFLGHILPAGLINHIIKSMYCPK